MKKLFFGLSFLIVAAMVLVACQPAATPTAEPTAAPAAEEPTAEPAVEEPTAEPATEEAPANPAADLSGTVRVGSWDNADALQPWDAAIASF